MSIKAFSFHSEHDLDQIETLLASHGTIQWRGGDNDYWREYLVARIAEGRVKLRVFVDKDSFVFDVSSNHGRPEFDSAVELVLSELLPLLGARDITPHPGWE